MPSSSFVLLASTMVRHGTPRWSNWEALTSGLLWGGFIHGNKFFVTWRSEPGAVTARRSQSNTTGISMLWRSFS